MAVQPAAIEWLYAREQVIAEPAGAAATAAPLKRPTAARTSEVLVTGSNIAPGLTDPHLRRGDGDSPRMDGFSAARRHEVGGGRARIHDPHATLLVVVGQAG